MRKSFAIVTLQNKVFNLAIGMPENFNDGIGFTSDCFIGRVVFVNYGQETVFADDN